MTDYAELCRELREWHYSLQQGDAILWSDHKTQTLLRAAAAIEELARERDAWKGTADGLEACLRGVQGYLSDDDGYEVNVAELRAENERLRDVLGQVSLLTDVPDFVRRYINDAALKGE